MLSSEFTKFFKFKHHAAIGNRQPKAERPRPLLDPAGMEGTDGVVDCKHVVCLHICFSFMFVYMWLCVPESTLVDESFLSVVNCASFRVSSSKLRLSVGYRQLCSCPQGAHDATPLAMPRMWDHRGHLALSIVRSCGLRAAGGQAWAGALEGE
jgi:hypothetical protein